jgi:hypothetical protein
VLHVGFVNLDTLQRPKSDCGAKMKSWWSMDRQVEPACSKILAVKRRSLRPTGIVMLTDLRRCASRVSDSALRRS